MIAHHIVAKFHLCASSHAHYNMSVSLRLWALHFFYFLIVLIHLQSLPLLRALLPQPREQQQHFVLRLKGDGVPWRLLPPRRLGAQELRPHGDLCRVLCRVPWPTHSSPRQGFFRGCGVRWHRALANASWCTPIHVSHSQREGLSVGQSSSSVSERAETSVGERTGRLVRPCGHEANVGNAQIGALCRQKEHILAECQAEMKKHEFEELLQQNLELREARDRSLNEFKELKKFQNSTCKTKISRGPEHYFESYWEDTGFSKWSKLFERFKGFSGCWISTQWKFPRYQSICVFHTLPSFLWNAEPFYRNAEPQRRAAEHLV